MRKIDRAAPLTRRRRSRGILGWRKTHPPSWPPGRALGPAALLGERVFLPFQAVLTKHLHILLHACGTVLQSLRIYEDAAVRITVPHKVLAPLPLRRFGGALIG